MTKFISLIIIAIVVATGNVAYALPQNNTQSSETQQLTELQRKVTSVSHPRLILREGQQMEDLRKTISNDIHINGLHHHILAEADKMTELPLLKYEKTGRRLLAVSNEALRRIFYLSYAYRTTGKTIYADRAIKEMTNVCKFSDWNESHFLDVAEMTMAVAIGYDWLYPRLTTAERKTVVKAIDEKAFAHVLGKPEPFYLTSTNNWNSVCNAGIAYGALAIIDDLPKRASSILKKSIESNPRALKAYQPDGGFPEGYGYWGYGTTFQVMLTDALESLLGYQAPGHEAFLQTGKYIQFMESPIGKCFNYSDNAEPTSGKVPLWWFAWKTGDKSLKYTANQYLADKRYRFPEKRVLPLVAVYASRLATSDAEPPVGSSISYGGETPIYIYRRGQEPANSVYLGVKGGSAYTSHGHQDAGSFVYDSDGIRWAMDLGIQDYYSLEKEGVDLWNKNQDSQRWEVLRMRNDYHNTLTINGGRHNVKARAEIVETFDMETKKGAKVDLTATLGGVKSALREVYLTKDDCLVVSDALQAGDKAAEIRWVMVTPAEAKITGNNTILLTKEGKRLELKFTSTGGLKLTPHIWDTRPIHEYDAANPGTCRVGFTTTLKKGKKATIRVVAKPIHE